MTFLKDWIINIVATMVFVTIVEIMTPGGSTRKYIGLVTGLMVMFVIINPFITLMAGDFNLDENVFETSRSIQLKDVSLQMEKLEQGNRENIIKLYKDNLEGQLKKDVEESGLTDNAVVEVEIDENQDKDYFGRIVGINIMIQEKRRDTHCPEGIKKVEKVEIKLEESEKKITEMEDMEEYQQILESLAHTYNLPQNRIIITAQ